MTGPSPQTRNVIAAILVVVSTTVFTAFSANWPEVYGFAASPSSTGWVSDQPIHLADDVMISLRAGRLLQETGRPSFNRVDVAQPSTSYLSPYLFALLLTVFSENVSVGVYAILGLCAGMLTLGLIVLFARSQVVAFLVVVAFALTKTNVMYSLKGWDHLFQALCLTFATCLTLASSPTRRGLFAISVALSFGSLFRPDGLLIAIGIFAALYVSCNSTRSFLVWGITPFLTIVSTGLIVNLVQFGSWTPTTARLKLGEAPSLEYAAAYILNNTVFSFTALTVFVGLSVVYVIAGRRVRGVSSVAIATGCAATAAIAAYNSDAFEGARMFWAPACVMAAMLAITFPGRRSPDVAPPDRRANRFVLAGVRHASLTVLVVLLLGVAFGWVLQKRIAAAVIMSDGIQDSLTAQQYLVARWIDKNLEPADGSVGLFFLGVGYHLPRFEIADFLGKADELIAGTESKWGPPGHNKWDIDRTLLKWQPQAIIPAAPSNPFLPAARAQAVEALRGMQDFAFAAALVTNDRVSTDFVYCYAAAVATGLPDKWGFFLRKDIAVRHRQRLVCSP